MTEWVVRWKGQKSAKWRLLARGGDVWEYWTDCMEAHRIAQGLSEMDDLDAQVLRVENAAGECVEECWYVAKSKITQVNPIKKQYFTREGWI